MKLFNKKYLSFLISHFSSQKGFTLIELLIVIAILGILAAGILVAINPVEQLARARDAGRKNTVPQLGKAVEAYFISKNAYPGSWTWVEDLSPGTGTGDIKKIPPTIGYSVSGTQACQVNKGNNYCYQPGTSDAIVYAELEAARDRTKCGPTEGTFFLYSVKYGAGIVCTVSPSTDPDIAASYHTFK